MVPEIVTRGVRPFGREKFNIQYLVGGLARPEGRGLLRVNAWFISASVQDFLMIYTLRHAKTRNMAAWLDLQNSIIIYGVQLKAGLALQSDQDQ